MFINFSWLVGFKCSDQRQYKFPNCQDPAKRIPGQRILPKCTHKWRKHIVILMNNHKFYSPHGQLDKVSWFKYTTCTQISDTYHDKLSELIMALFSFSLPMAREDIRQSSRGNRSGDMFTIMFILMASSRESVIGKKSTFLVT